MLIGGLAGLVQELPFPGQQFVQPRRGKIGDPGEDVGEPGLWIDVVEAAGRLFTRVPGHVSTDRHFSDENRPEIRRG